MGDDVRIRLAKSRADFDACVEVQRAVWRLSDLEITSALQMIATTHAGGLVQLAERAGRIVGFAHALPALRGGVPHLHSDMVAVLPEDQKHGIGVQLKWAQREEALARGITLVTWTYDPLQARNATLNLHRLGAVADEFHPDFYGITSSALHHGLPTDRLLVRWELNVPRVRERAAQGEPPRKAPGPTFPRINDVKWQAGWPVSSDPRTDLTAPAPPSPWETSSDCWAVSEPPTLTRSTTTPGTSRRTDQGSVGRGTDRSSSEEKAEDGGTVRSRGPGGASGEPGPHRSAIASALAVSTDTS
ncbi:MAG TPA: GNAT family N-acetyltransferase, partial [Vicinamibacteria bacterium]